MLFDLFDDKPNDDEQIAKRDEFQRNVSASEIKRIENKMLDFHLRSRDDHAGHGLTKDERNIYADFLETKSDFQGAKSFRDYEPPIVKEKKRK